MVLFSKIGCVVKFTEENGSQRSNLPPFLTNEEHSHNSSTIYRIFSTNFSSVTCSLATSKNSNFFDRFCFSPLKPDLTNLKEKRHNFHSSFQEYLEEKTTPFLRIWRMNEGSNPTTFFEFLVPLLLLFWVSAL